MTQEKLLQMLTDSVQKAITENKDDFQKMLSIGINKNMDVNEVISQMSSNCLTGAITLSSRLVFYHLIALGVIDPENYEDDLPHLHLVK